MCSWGSQHRSGFMWNVRKRGLMRRERRGVFSNQQEQHSVESGAAQHRLKVAQSRDRKTIVGGWRPQAPSSAPPKLDPGGVQWDLLCFCCKAPALLNTHSESLGKLCNHASASWQRTAVWLQIRSAPWRHRVLWKPGARRGLGVWGERGGGGSPEGNLKEAVPQHLYLVCVSPLRNRQGSGAGTTTLCKLLAKWTSQAEMSGGRNIQTIDMLYYMHVKVLNSVRKKKNTHHDDIMWNSTSHCKTVHVWISVPVADFWDKTDQNQVGHNKLQGSINIYIRYNFLWYSARRYFAKHTTRHTLCTSSCK